jgi:hypothetical protein
LKLPTSKRHPSYPHLILMNDRSTTVESRFLLGALVCALLLIVNYFAFVGTPWGQKFDNDAFLGRKTLDRKIITLDSDILNLVRKRTLFFAAVVMLAVAVMRRCTFVGVIAVAAFGCAVVGAEVLKHVLPWRVLVPNDAMLNSGFQTNTYPSGHTTAVTSLALSLLWVSPSRWRPWLAIAGGFISATFATGVLFVGWHRPSDALGALAWSGLCMSVAAAFVIRLQGRQRPAYAFPNRAALGCIALGILVAAAIRLFSAAAAAPTYPLTGLPFFMLTGFIIAGAFTLIAWYGWQLRAVDWLADSIA